MILAFTGHRLQNGLGGFKPCTKHTQIRSEMIRRIQELNPDSAIVGGALGIDTWAAQILLLLDIPYTLAIPFEGQESIWPKESQEIYKYLRSKARNEVLVCGTGYAAWKMQKRNEWMVNNSDQLLAVWNGSPGGTGNCVNYAKSKNKIIHYIDPDVDWEILSILEE